MPIFRFKQVGQLEERHESNGIMPKGFEIEILKTKQIKECPLVLASTKANRYLSAGTFIELQEKYHLGNIKAIDYLLNGEKIRVHLNDFTEYLKCLSSVEFETLIAKIVEEIGFFVPAYKGGFIKNFDLVCRNLKEIPLEIDEEEILPGETKSIQIKTTLRKNDYDEKGNDGVDFYFCIVSTIKEKPNVFVAQDIEDFLDSCPKTLDWLEKTLCWADKPVPS